MRIGFQQTAVHVGAGVAFVAIADEVLRRLFLCPAHFPLDARGESRTAATAQPGARDLIDHLLGGQRRERQPHALVAVPGEIIVDLLRVDEPFVAQNHRHLFMEKWNVRQRGDGLFRFGGDKHELLDGSALDDVLFDQSGGISGLEPSIESLVRHDDGQRALAAEAVASSRDHAHLIAEALVGNFFVEGILEFEGAASDTAGAAAHHEVFCLAAELNLLDRLFLFLVQPLECE